MDAADYQNGEPAWQDHSSPDDAKAAEFYSGLFGWDCPPGDPEFGGYRSCTLDGKAVAGISPQMQPGPTVWATYIKADDAAATMEKVAPAGGQVIVPAMQIGDFGTMGFFVDPTGAALGVWQTGTHKGAEVRDQHGAPCWHELVTSDVDAAAEFYKAVFGWEARGHGPSDAGGYQELRLGDKVVGGMMAKPPGMPSEAPSFWGIYFAVDDTDASAAKAQELGGTVLMGPKDIEPGRFAVIQDSTGAVFNILHSSR